MVRPENGLFFANAEAFRELIIAELTSNTEPVKAVLLDLGATTDLDVPSADMLGELGEELRSRDVRFMVMHMITPVKQMLESAGALEKIRPQDIFVGPAEAVLDYLSSQYDDARILELLRSGAISVHNLLQASLVTAPAERKAALIAVAESVGKGIEPVEPGKQQND